MSRVSVARFAGGVAVFPVAAQVMPDVNPAQTLTAADAIAAKADRVWPSINRVDDRDESSPGCWAEQPVTLTRPRINFLAHDQSIAMPPRANQIGRASCRERVEIPG